MGTACGHSKIESHCEGKVKEKWVQKMGTARGHSFERPHFYSRAQVEEQNFGNNV